jgi:hypothetical protein
MLPILDAIAVSTDGLTTPQLSGFTPIPLRTLQNWKKRIGEGGTVTPQDKERSDFFDHWKLGDDGLWYRKN